MKVKGVTKDTRISSVPYSVIVLAVRGDVDAINAVIKHYEGYITVLATRRFHDEYGNLFLYIDEMVRRRLETKLITAILNFNAA